jgi:hypothetical protein
MPENMSNVGNATSLSFVLFDLLMFHGPWYKCEEHLPIIAL